MEGCTRSSSVSSEPPGWKALKLHGATSSNHLQGEKVLSSYLRNHTSMTCGVILDVDEW